MSTGATSGFRLVDNVAEYSVDAFHAMHQMGLLEIFEGTEHGYAVESEQQIDYFLVREGSTGGQHGRKDLLPCRGRTKPALFQHIGCFYLAVHASFYYAV